MALYGPFTPAGYVPFTGYSPTLGPTDAVIPVTSGQVFFQGMTQDDKQISSYLRRPANRVLRRLILTLLGAASGSNAQETRTRVFARQAQTDPSLLGGAVTIETVNLINRVTTATDITNITALLNRVPAPSSYAVDVAGNGGGGRLGF